MLQFSFVALLTYNSLSFVSLFTFTVFRIFHHLLFFQEVTKEAIFLELAYLLNLPQGH